MDTTIFEQLTNTSPSTIKAHMSRGKKLNTFIGKTKLSNINRVNKLLIKNVPVKSTRHIIFTQL